MSTLLGPDQAHRGPIRRIDAIFGGPVWWATHLGGMYWLVPRTCELGSNWPIHLLTVLMAAACARAAVSSVQILRAAREAREGGDVSVAADRDQYLGWLGLVMSIFFGAVVVFEGIPAAFLSGCW